MTEGRNAMMRLIFVTMKGRIFATIKCLSATIKGLSATIERLSATMKVSLR